MIDRFKLPLHFDIERMQKEVLAFSDEDWVEHFNKGYYNGDWSAIPFRSVNGDPRRIFPDPTGKGVYMDTPNLERCPYLREVVDSFACEKIDIRLLRLKAGSSIKEHKDFGLEFEDGEVRLHIPVVTNEKLEFYLNRERVIMQEGDCWYLNFNLPHSVVNNSEVDRIHLVIDCKLNDWLGDFFPKTVQKQG